MATRRLRRAMSMPVYQSSSNAAPDSDFEPGSLHHLVPGNVGRMLDARRTPVSVVEVRMDTGFIVLRIEDFEDAGAIWQVPLEDVDHYQFAREARRAPDATIDEMRRAIEHFDREMVLQADAADRLETTDAIKHLEAGADDWLAEHSRFVREKRRLPDPATRRGDEVLAADLEAYMNKVGLWDIEEAFARQFVSNPHSGDLVKGHRVVLAELGLASYTGPIVRDPATLTGSWERRRRADHIRARLAFLRALFARLGIERVILWRGLTAETPLRLSQKRTFVSTSFAEAVARSHFESDTDRPTRVLMCQSAPVDRLFMTYLETSAMNDRFFEAEAVLIARPGDGWP